MKKRKNFSSKFTRKKEVANKDIKETVVGIYSEKEGFGFVDVEGREKGYFVFEKNKGIALNGDKVEAEVRKFKGRKEAIITNIVERRKGLIIGKFDFRKGDFGFVIPDNKVFKNDIFVYEKNFNGAKNGDLVAVEIRDWTGKSPRGVIKEIIGTGKNRDKREETIKSLILEAGAKIDFPSFPPPWGEGLREGEQRENDRKDLKNLFTFTIDGEDAKDLDDAISVKKLDNGDFLLFVHIADVSHYVREGTLLDKEALERGTSIYLADRVIPMLPEKLSNDLCSLNPHTDKLTMTCEMKISGKTGQLISSKVYNSLIRSDFRLTYKDVDNICPPRGGGCHGVTGGATHFGQKITKELLETLQISNELKELVLAYRKRNGMLDFDFKETRIKFDDKKVIAIEEYPKYESNKLIEAFMVSANEAVAKEFSNIPFLYRIHEKPKEEDILELNEKLNLFGVKFQLKEGSTKEFEELLEIVEKTKKEKKYFIEISILRSLAEANYSSSNVGHFGLGLKFYSHFTSPIRRYPDLQIHRIIKEAERGKLKTERNLYYKKLLPEVAKKCIEREKIAEKLEYKVRDYFVAEFYKDKVGQVFEGVISGMIPKGFFVALPDTSEGFVEMKDCVFDDKLWTFRDDSGKKYTLGDNIKVKLFEVDMKLFRLNFCLI